MNNLKIKNVNEMTIDELIGQVIMVGLPYTYLDDEYKKFIKDYSIGNYILFARNYTDTVQMKKLMNELYEYTQNITGSFPLVSIDQEGGMVVRLFQDVTFPASPLTTSATTIPNAPYITGKIIGKDMLKLGINLNLAPCLEVNENLANPLVNVRGYGATKETVLKNATQFVNGLQESKVLSCIKHFPGAGSSTKDSHLELPIINDTKEQLLNYNMYPFSKLLHSDALMTSHCIYNAFDIIPSTLSKVLLTDVLRNQFGFKGLIISDGMEMKAISDHYGIGNGCVMALNAGCDILLLCHEYTEQKAAFDFVKSAVNDGTLKIEVLKEKVKRINFAKTKIIDALIKNFNDDIYIKNDNEHNLMQEIVDNSYTLIKGSAPKITDKTLIIAANAKIGSIVEDEFDERNLVNALTHNFPNNKVVKFSDDTNFTSQILSIVDNYNNVIVYTYDAYRDNTQINTINELLKLNKDIYIVSIKGPGDRIHFKGLINYSCLYEYTPNSIKTIIKQLKGEISLNGNLPN